MAAHLEYSGNHRCPVHSLQATGPVCQEVSLARHKFKKNGRHFLSYTQGNHWISHVTPFPAPHIFLLRCCHTHTVWRAPVCHGAQPREQLTHAPDSFPVPCRTRRLSSLCAFHFAHQRYATTAEPKERAPPAALITRFPSSAAGSWKQFLSPIEMRDSSLHLISTCPGLELSNNFKKLFGVQ